MNKALFIGVLVQFFLIGCSSTSEKDKKLQKAEIHYGHGTGNLMRKNYTEALEHLIQAVKLDPTNSDYHNNLGMAYYLKGETQFAILHINKSLELNPKNSDARTNLASILYRLGKVRKSRQLYAEVLKDLVYKAQHRVYFNLAMIEKDLKNSKKMEKYLKQAIVVKEDYCPALFQLGLYYREEREHRKALEYFEKGSKGLCFDHPAPQYYQALSLIDLKKYTAAKFKLDDVMERFQSTSFAPKAAGQISRLRAILGEEFQKLDSKSDPISFPQESNTVRSFKVE